MKDIPRMMMMMMMMTIKDIVDTEYKKKFIRKIVCRYLFILLPMTGVTDTRHLFVLQFTKYDLSTPILESQRMHFKIRNVAFQNGGNALLQET